MSDKQKYGREVALKVAEDLQSRLKLACRRMAVAGSLRRGKETVGDVELLFVPVLAERADGLFDRRLVSVADEVCNELLRDGILAKRPNVKGHFTWGEANKLAVHVASGVPVDFFSTTEDNWWVSLVIRTGSKETNLKLTNGAIHLGRKLHAYGSGVTMPDGSTRKAQSEQEVFELCGVPYLEPKDR